jgi:hypothetical protein
MGLYKLCNHKRRERDRCEPRGGAASAGFG